MKWDALGPLGGGDRARRSDGALTSALPNVSSFCCVAGPYTSEASLPAIPRLWQWLVRKRVPTKRDSPNSCIKADGHIRVFVAENLDILGLS